MKKPILYTDIASKKKMTDIPERLSFKESFIRALDLIDFYVAISDPKDLKSREDDDIEWIELTWRRKK
jgi:hypothetical protein